MAIRRCNESNALVQMLPIGFVTAVRKFAALYENEVRFHSGSTLAIGRDWPSNTLLARLPSGSTSAVRLFPASKTNEVRFPSASTWAISLLAPSKHGRADRPQRIGRADPVPKCIVSICGNVAQRVRRRDHAARSGRSSSTRLRPAGL